MKTSFTRARALLTLSYLGAFCLRNIFSRGSVPPSKICKNQKSPSPPARKSSGPKCIKNTYFVVSSRQVNRRAKISHPNSKAVKPDLQLSKVTHANAKTERKPIWAPPHFTSPKSHFAPPFALGKKYHPPCSLSLV